MCFYLFVVCYIIVFAGYFTIVLIYRNVNELLNTKLRITQSDQYVTLGKCCERVFQVVHYIT